MLYAVLVMVSIILYHIQYSASVDFIGGKMLMQWENGYKVYNCLKV